MNIHKNINFFKIAKQLELLLREKGITFRDNGFPDLTDFNYIDHVPDDIEMWPYDKRNQSINPNKAVLNFFEDDRLLYGYLNTLNKVICNLSIYYAVTGFDISPCIDYSEERQHAALLLNALVNGLFLTAGIRVIPSLRIGSMRTINTLKCYPRGICYAFGALGCNQKFKNIGCLITEAKTLLCEPSQVLAYGNLTNTDLSIFNKWGIPVLNIPDYQTRTRNRTSQRVNANV